MAPRWLSSLSDKFSLQDETVGSSPSELHHALPPSVGPLALGLVRTRVGRHQNQHQQQEQAKEFLFDPELDADAGPGPALLLSLGSSSLDSITTASYGCSSSSSSAVSDRSCALAAAGHTGPPPAQHGLSSVHQSGTLHHQQPMPSQAHQPLSRPKQLHMPGHNLAPQAATAQAMQQQPPLTPQPQPPQQQLTEPQPTPSSTFPPRTAASSWDTGLNSHTATATWLNPRNRQPPPTQQQQRRQQQRQQQIGPLTAALLRRSQMQAQQQRQQSSVRRSTAADLPSPPPFEATPSASAHSFHAGRAAPHPRLHLHPIHHNHTSEMDPQGCFGTPPMAQPLQRLPPSPTSLSLSHWAPDYNAAGAWRGAQVPGGQLQGASSFPLEVEQDRGLSSDGGGSGEVGRRFQSWGSLEDELGSSRSSVAGSGGGSEGAWGLLRP